MTSKLHLFSKNKMYALYLTESMQTDWRQTLDEYWYQGDAPYSYGFGFCTECLFQYFNEMALGGAIEIDYLIWKPEQHKLIPKYYTLHSLVIFIKHYFVTM